MSSIGQLQPGGRKPTGRGDTSCSSAAVPGTILIIVIIIIIIIIIIQDMIGSGQLSLTDQDGNILDVPSQCVNNCPVEIIGNILTFFKEKAVVAAFLTSYNINVTN